MKRQDLHFGETVSLFPCKRADNRKPRTGNQRRFPLTCKSAFSFSQAWLVSRKVVDGLLLVSQDGKGMKTLVRKREISRHFACH